MKIDHTYTPVENRPNRTVYRFTEEEVIVALRIYLSTTEEVVPQGKRVQTTIWHPSSTGKSGVSLVVDHPDPPPKA